MKNSAISIENWKENSNALQMLSKFIDSNQQCIDAYQMRIELLVPLRDFESAIKDCQTLVLLEPSVENQKKLKIVQNLNEGT